MLAGITRSSISLALPIAAPPRKSRSRSCWYSRTPPAPPRFSGRFPSRYFNNFRVKKVVPETFEKDLSRYNNHLAPYFKETLIKSITPTHCQNLLERLTEQEKWKTASELYSLMNGIFDCAIDHHIIQFSPMDTVQAIEYEKESGSALLIEEEGHLLLAVKDTPYEI